MCQSQPFLVWKELLRIDFVKQDKLRQFHSLGESVLRILYENDVDPTVEAIVKDGMSGPVEDA